MATKGFKLITPAGTARFTYLDKPDASKLGKNKYKCTLLLQKGVEANDALAKKLNDAHKAAKGKADKRTVKDGDALVEDDAEKNAYAAGKWVLTAKTTTKPDCVDAAKKATKAARSGDTVKLALFATEYSVDGTSGVTCYLNAVQVLARGETSGAADAFSDESDTYGETATAGSDDDGAAGTVEGDGSGDF